MYIFMYISVIYDFFFAFVAKPLLVLLVLLLLTMPKGGRGSVHGGKFPVKLKGFGPGSER